MSTKNERSNAAVATADNYDLVITREFDAPRDAVFKAWTDPKMMMNWWGPHTFTTPRCELDVRPGGAIAIDMRGPDGAIYSNHGAFREVVAPERLVFTLAFDDDKGELLFDVLITANFAERAGKTTLTLEARALTVKPGAEIYLSGMEDGWTQSLERLEDLAPSLAPDSDQEIVATRVFDAPRELVFRMWIDPKHIAQWWGPNGFTNTIQNLDVRPGGEFELVMHGPDGTDYKNKFVYQEVAAPRRLVYDHLTGPLFRATVTFAELGEQTRVNVRMRFDSARIRKQTAEEHGAVEGLNQTLAHLAEQLAKVAGEDLLLTRVFDAPREVVFDAWTKAEHLKQWWGPKGFKMIKCSVDLRPGGMFHYGMEAPNGSTMWGRFVYREITPPERLVFFNSFSDENGGVQPAPFFDGWPLEVLNVVTFTEHEGKTIVSLRGAPFAATEEERAKFKSMHPSMQQGFGGTFAQLDDYLAKAVK
jgi:uncharacterized protein YndB with AHSA1/START domain